MPDVDQSLTKVNPDKLLETMTEEYMPLAHVSGIQPISRNRPPFTRQMIREMLSDPRVNYGLRLLKGPLLSKGPRRKGGDSGKASATASPMPPQFQMAFPPEKKAKPFEGKSLFSGGNDNDEAGNNSPFPPKKNNPFQKGTNGFPPPKKAESEVQGFSVQCEHDGVKKFIEDNLVRFWRTEAIKALTALEWGFSGSEPIYRVRNGELHFDRLRDFLAEDVTPVRFKGKLVGMHVQMSGSTTATKNRVYLGGPKALWHVHWRDRNAWWGVSRLYGAHIPWWEKWCDGGYRDIRRLWYFKNSFEGGVMYHPAGSTRLDNNLVVPNKDLAREIMEKKRAGGIMALPNTPMGDGGTRAWEYEAPAGNTAPEGLLDYGSSLDTETLEALGIPPEVIESSGNQGFGSSTGRQVPQEAFESILQELIQWLIWDFDQQILRFLIPINFSGGDEIDYDIIPTPIGEQGGIELGGGNQPGDYHGNQWQENDGEAKDQDQIDAEKMDRAGAT